MTIYYRGNETAKPPSPVKLEPLVRDDNPANYTADANLAAAVNVALILSKPLLVTGEPGTGKTELARHAAMALGLAEPERFDTRSTSQAMELFYRLDSLARFQAANIEKEKRSALDFISFGPLGAAILRSLPPTHAVFQALKLPYPSPPGAKGNGKPAETPTPSRSVILIDEIDKAPRDFPNDLLDAIENLRFSIRELDRESLQRLTDACGTADITADRALRPIVIITSNSEKNLPPPFLRRCVYYHIPFPGASRLRAIVARRVRGTATSGPLTGMKDAELAATQDIPETAAQPLLRSAVDLFENIRASDLTKPPSTAELIDWVRYLIAAGARATQELKDIPDLVRESLGVLVKSVEDLDAVRATARSRFPLPDEDHGR